MGVKDSQDGPVRHGGGGFGSHGGIPFGSCHGQKLIGKP